MTGQTADGWQWCRRPGAVMHYPNRPALNTDLSLMTSELFPAQRKRRNLVSMRPPQRPNTSHAMTSVLFTVILFVGWTITSQFGMVSRKARNVHETSAPSLARFAGRFRGRGGRDAGILEQ